jgi:DNA (cytosine-5)-methyltransferase 1
VQFKVEATDLGFKIVEGVLNAADFGVAQRRKRAIVIGMKDAMPALPEPTHAEVATLRGEQPWVTFRQAVAGLPLVPDGENWHTPRSPHDVSLIRYSRVPHDGGNRFEMQRALEADGLGHLIPPCWRRKTAGTTDVFGRLWWDRPAVTLRTEFFKPEKGRYLHPSEDRAITLREGARCMGFPDDFIFPGDQSMTAVGRQIGNAVPPLLGQRVAEAVLEALEDRGELQKAA